MKKGLLIEKSYWVRDETDVEFTTLCDELSDRDMNSVKEFPPWQFVNNDISLRFLRRELFAYGINLSLNCIVLQYNFHCDCDNVGSHNFLIPIFILYSWLWIKIVIKFNPILKAWYGIKLHDNTVKRTHLHFHLSHLLFQLHSILSLILIVPFP